jgi:porphyrinogen peroxidase
MRSQAGVFALGTVEHCFLELDARGPGDRLVRAGAAIEASLPTTGGSNVVVGFRPELWASVAPDDAPDGFAGWTEPLHGADGFAMPATQHDAWIWVSGGDRTGVFDATRTILQALAATGSVATEVRGWPYAHDRDLTGFIDGTENPRAAEAGEVVSVPAGSRGEGSTLVLYQLWRHDSVAWEALGTRRQELAMGRTKDDSTELAPDVMPPDAHVARMSFDRDGVEQHIFRRNVAYGGASDHGTVFVGFSRDQWRLVEMLRRMGGEADGVRDALTRYLTPWAGAYYTVPSVEALAAVATPRS